MPVTNPVLPLHAAEIERTLVPLERATQLPGRAFTDPAVVEWERANVFRRGWICAGHVERVSERGLYVQVDVGGESVLVVGDDDGLPRAFLNTCRHRGARLVDDDAGRLRRLQCPYHAWAYGFDGALKRAPFTDGLVDFDPGCFGLHEVRLAVVEGLVLLDLSGEAPPPQDHIGDLATHMAAYRLPALRRAARIVYDVPANWKAIAENYSECLHCPGVHPELNRLSHYLTGETIAGVDLRSILYFLIFPNALISLHPDYVMLHTLWPKAPDRTEVVCEWFFEPEEIAREGFDASDAVEFWDQVNREDWHVCGLTQRGMQSHRFVPGRYTTQEGDVHAFDTMVARRYLEALQ